MMPVHVVLADDGPLTAAQRDHFEKKIRPVLVEHCYRCHSADAEKLGGQLRLDSRAATLAGGASGPALIPGQPDDSLIIQALRYEHLEMPPEKPLPEAVIADFAKWIKQGAADPRKEPTTEPPDEPFDRSALWSFLAREQPPLPMVQGAAWPRDPLDHFVLAKIEAAKLQPTTDAGPATLIRRLHNDLLGLPPTFEQVQTFVAEYEQEGRLAVERLVDHLLASPHFGERWGRHWLDVTRYGESNGDDGLGRNATFPHAWRYRDYVIQAFNDDISYDRFLTEQIAGDLLPAESAEERNRLLVATGFLAIGSKPAFAMNQNFAMDIVDDQINVISTAILGLSVACARCHDHKHDPIPTRDYYALAGIFTSTETLYGLAGNEKLTAPPTPLHELNSYDDRQPPPPVETPQFAPGYAETIQQLQPAVYAPLNVAPEQLKVESEVQFSAEEFAAVESARLHGKLPSEQENYSVSFWFKNKIKNDSRPITAYLFSRGELGNGNNPGEHLGIGGAHNKETTGRLFVFNEAAAKGLLVGPSVIPPNTWNHVVLIRQGKQITVFLNGQPEPEIQGTLPATFGDCADFCLAARSDRFAPLVGNLAQLAVFDRALTPDEAQQLHAASGQPRRDYRVRLAMGVREKKPVDCKIHINGESNKLGPLVPRGFLTAYEQIPGSSSPVASDDAFHIPADQSGRLQLARWLTRPEQPQTARVIINRIWLHLFGQGLVETPDDFGVYGARPTHPQLLDHLAGRFVADGWSIKRMIRTIVLSRAYQLDSRADGQLIEADPANQLLARHHRRRLDAESLRDAILKVSGQLNSEPGQGSAVEKIDRLINWPPGEATDLHRPSRHRSIYLCMLRHSPPPELSAFDLPSGVEITGQRNVTTLPTQALFLFNNPLVIEQSHALAAEVLALPDLDEPARVQTIYRRVLQREPSPAESSRALAHVQRIAPLIEERTGEQEAQASLSPEIRSWASLCRALLMTNEFRYID